MTDIALDDSGDLIIENGQIPLLGTIQESTRQRLQISLSTISGEWFKDINFGVPRELLFSKGTQGMLDAAVVEIIVGTDGIQSITEFESSLDAGTRVYTVNFSAITDSGEVVTLEGLEVT
jgi:hypothetical protein